MKKFIFIFLSLILMQNLQAQNPKNKLTVYTHDSLAVFQLFVNGNRVINFHLDSITLNDIDSAMVNITVSFKDRTIADKTEEVSFIETSERVYEILPKPGVFRKIAKGGRNVGKQLNIGNHENEETLQDLFYLKDRTVLEQFKK